jgi:hypothetical protein
MIGRAAGDSAFAKRQAIVRNTGTLVRAIRRILQSR